MGKNRLHRGHAIPDFIQKFSTEIEKFSLKIRQTSAIQHSGSKGTEREGGIAHFVGELLPKRYEASTGEVVDLKGQRSAQLDVLIFDCLKNFPLYRGDIVVLPAEALLATVEVKSKLTNTEAKNAQDAAQKLKRLQPMKQKLRQQKENAPASQHTPYRYLHSVFAYATDLGDKDWASKELARLDAHAPGGEENAVDFVYVLDRGLIDCRSRKFIPEDKTVGQALVAWWFGIYNFIDRENSRRTDVPYFSYANDLNKFWDTIP